ncbi:MAG TPA: IscS subfamily cysteine desulfurase [Bacillus bacterium]|nr:IscS subfamily cysteine desulfurase [Bacillus sp. (in: firmicutes)]
MIYLDYAATTPMSEKALHVYSQVASQFFGNSSSLHDIGATAQTILEESRKTIASFINGDAKGIFFTSGGSESNYLAIHSLLKGQHKQGKHIISTKLEHSSIANTLDQLEESGYEITFIPVNEEGRVNLEALSEAIRPDTVLATIHHGNSEIGAIQDLVLIGELLNKHDILFHSDCVQTFGKIEIDAREAKLDSISISSHKIYGPKGVGACYINPARTWKAVIPNTTHESGFRPGTVNVPGIAAFVAAAEEVFPIIDSEQKRFTYLREMLINGIQSDAWTITELGPSQQRLEHIIGLTVAGIEGQYVMLECNRYGVAISTGSACAVGMQKPSKTLVAIGKSKEEAKQFVRLSLGKLTTEAEIKKTINIFQTFLKKHFNVG